MKYFLIFIVFLLTGCIGYTNTSKMSTDIKSAPYETYLPPYLEMEKYGPNDIFEINKNNKLIADKTDGNVRILEYSVPRVGRPQWTGFAVLLPILVPKYHRFSADKIKYILRDDKLVDIKYDYYKTHNKIFPLLPFDDFGKPAPQYATTLQAERNPEWNFDTWFNNYVYHDAFFTNRKKICDISVNEFGEEVWDIYGMKMPALLKPTLVPQDFKLQNDEYYDYDCQDDICTKMVCANNVCKTLNQAKAERIEYTKNWRFAEYDCDTVPGLGISGVRFKYNDDGKTYIVQAIKNPVNNYNIAELIKHIDYEPQVMNTNRISHKIYNKTINGTDTTIINSFHHNCNADCTYYDVYKAIFTDPTNIYYVQISFAGGDIKNHDINCAEFERFLQNIHLN